MLSVIAATVVILVLVVVVVMMLVVIAAAVVVAAAAVVVAAAAVVVVVVVIAAAVVVVVIAAAVVVVVVVIAAAAAVVVIIVAAAVAVVVVVAVLVVVVVVVEVVAVAAAAVVVLSYYIAFFLTLFCIIFSFSLLLLNVYDECKHDTRQLYLSYAVFKEDRHSSRTVNRMRLFHNRAVSITLPSGINKLGKMLFKISTGYISLTDPDGAVVMSSANGLVGTGFASHYGSNPERVFKDPIGRCMATTPSSFSLTSNRVTTNY